MSSSGSSSFGEDFIEYDIVWNHVAGEKPKAPEIIDCIRFRPLPGSPSPSVSPTPSSDPVSQAAPPATEPTHRLVVFWRDFRAGYTCHFDPTTTTLSALTLCDLNPTMCSAVCGQESIDLTTDTDTDTDKYTHLHFLAHTDENGNPYLLYRISLHNKPPRSIILLGKRSVASEPAAALSTHELKRLGVWDEHQELY